ncbi:MAG: hypothetical protein FWD18_08575 [Micrococcales bacterium]|nr:hypothetical protein [Micrococcales bacterium]
MIASVGLPAPRAVRLRQPGVRDPRLLVGLALIVASVLGGVWFVSSASGTVAVYAAGSALVPGTSVARADLVQVQVRGVDVDRYLRVDGSFPDDAVVLRAVEAGELVPVSAVGEASAVEVRPVTIELPRAPGRDLATGAQVELWVTPTGRDDPGKPSRLVARATVAAVTTSTGSPSPGTVEVVLPAEGLAPVLAALAGDGVVDVVVVPGAGG